MFYERNTLFLTPALNVVPAAVHLFIYSGIMALMEAKFFRFLKVVGVGFKVRAKAGGRLLYLKLGYSHKVELTVPPAVRLFCFKPNIICCTGLDKEESTSLPVLFAAVNRLRFTRAKVILYIDEVVKKKQGKKSK